MTTNAAPAPLELEPYAAVTAELDLGRPRDATLEREGISTETWARAQAYWLKRMADEAERKRFEVTLRYQAIFQAKRKVAEARLRREKQKGERKEPVPPPVGPLAAAQRELDAPIGATPPPMRAPEPPPVFERPTYALPAAAAPAFAQPAAAPLAQPPIAQPPIAQPPVAPPPQVVAPVRMSNPRAPSPADLVQPAYAAPPQIVVPAEPRITEPAKPRKQWTTMAAPIEPPPEAAMPFRARTADEAPPSAAQPVPVTPKKKANLGATMMADDAPTGDATPFLRGPAAPAPPAPPPAVSAPPLVTPSHVALAGAAVAAPEPPRRSAKLGSTMMADESMVAAAAMPFDKLAAAGAPPPQAPPPASTMPFPPSIALPVAGASATAQTMPPDTAPLPSRVPGPAMPLPVPPAATIRKKQDLGATMMADDAPHGEAALPFRGGPPAPPPPSAADVRRATPPPMSAVAPHTPEGRRFPINVFASLTAEIADNPADVEAIRKRYGVTEAEHHEESQRWTEEFARDDDVRKRYLGIVQRYRGYLQQRKR